MIEQEQTLAALDALESEKPEQHRVLMYALSNPGATHEQIAQALGCGRANITRQLQRARDSIERFKQRAKSRPSS